MLCQLRAPTTSLSQLRNLYKFSAKSRKTGRMCGNFVKPSAEWRYQKSFGRTFTRLNGVRFGVDMGLEDRLLLISLGQKHRRLDDKKMKQLSDVYERKLYELIACHEELAGRDIAFTKVRVDKSLTEVVVHWMCTGIEDDQTSALLDTSRHVLRRQLSDAIGGGTVPEVKFVPDRTQLLEQEMERLFRKADYGVDYRTLSNTARVMGSVKPSVEDQPEVKRKSKPSPEWKVRRELRLRQQATDEASSQNGLSAPTPASNERIE